MAEPEVYIAEHRGWRSLADGVSLARYANEYTTGWERTGVELEPYAGTHFIETDTVLDSQYIDLDGLFVAHGANVQITRSYINAFIDVDAASSLLLEDCNVDGPLASNPAISYYNLEIRRCEITGGQHSVQGANILIENSLLHRQYNDPNSLDGYHNNAFISNGGNNVTIRGCTLDCSTALTPNGGGPTGALSIFGDFSSNDNFLIEDNYFMTTTGSYTVSGGYNPAKPFGSTPTNIRFLNNVFEKRSDTGFGGQFGTVTSFRSLEPTNEWTNNRFVDGTLIPAVE